MFEEWFLCSALIMGGTFFALFLLVVINNGQGDGFEGSLSFLIITFGIGLCLLGHGFTKIDSWQSPYLLTLFVLLAHVFYGLGGIISLIGLILLLMVTNDLLGFAIVILPVALMIGLFKYAKDKIFPQKIPAQV